MPMKIWVGSLRIKLTTRSITGEKTVFIAGRRIKTIQEQITKRITDQDRYALVSAVLADRNGRVITEKSINLKASKQSLESFLDCSMIKSFLKYNVSAKREN